MIKFVYLDRHWSMIKKDYAKNLNELWSQGKVVYEDLHVVDLIKQHTNRKYVTLTNSCTDAITMMIQATVEPDSEIICPAYSFYATAHAISRAGCKPAFVDIDENYHLDLAKIKITTKTKAMLFVSLFGNPMNYAEVVKFCKDNNIVCLEDAAQSFGSAYDNHKSGAVGLASALSFSPSKPSPTFGFIGAVATDNEALFDHVTDAKKHGVSNGTVGHNSNPASALVLQLQHSLEHHELCQKHRNDLASMYDTSLCDSVVLPHRQGKHNWSKYVIQTDQRDAIKKFLDKQGIETKIHYATLLPKYKMYHRHTIYPTAEKLARTSLSLPIDAWMTNKECKTVCDAIKEFFA